METGNEMYCIFMDEEIFWTALSDRDTKRSRMSSSCVAIVIRF